MSLDSFVTYVLDLYIALRWALLARKCGSINSGSPSRLRVYTSLAESEALEVLSPSGALITQIIFANPLIKAIP